MNKAELFSVTSPSADMTPEESIVYQARVSSPNQRTEDADKLLHYLVKHGHWSPFDMVDMVVEIQTSRAIMAQILRHFSFRFQEFSQRYAQVGEIDWSGLEMRKAGSTNRQASLEVDTGWSDYAVRTCERLEKDYNYMLDEENTAIVATESARMILPLATPTQGYMKGSVRSWMTYFWQRLDVHAQKEHRELAFMMFEIFKKEFPVIADLVENYRPQVVKGKWIQEL